MEEITRHKHWQRQCHCSLITAICFVVLPFHKEAIVRNILWLLALLFPSLASGQYCSTGLGAKNDHNNNRPADND